MKALRYGLTVSLLLSALNVASAHAQMSWDIAPELGLNIDNDELFIGANARFELATAPIVLNPGIDIYPFIGNGSLFVLNFDVLYPLNAQTIDPYIGGGLFWSRATANVAGVSVSASDIGINLKGGIVFQTAGPLRPFGEAGLAVGDGSAFTLKGGLLFGIGG